MKDQTRLVCIGDSFTEGVHDELRPDGRFIGWSDRLAQHIADAQGPSISYANLAVRGKVLDQIATEQCAAALKLSPTIITVHAGANDVLRPRTDLADLLIRYDSLVRTLTKPSHSLVMFTSIGRAGGTGRLAQSLADRFAHFNEGIRAIAELNQAVLVDLERVSVLTDRRMWHEDRLHLNADGHARVAAAAAFALGVSNPEVLGGHLGWWEEPLPADNRGRLAKGASDVAWIGQHLLPWVGRRLRGVSSGDSVSAKDPQLVSITARSVLD